MSLLSLIICESLFLVIFLFAYLLKRRGSRKIRTRNQDNIKKIVNKLRHNCK